MLLKVPRNGPKLAKTGSTRLYACQIFGSTETPNTNPRYNYVDVDAFQDYQELYAIKVWCLFSLPFYLFSSKIIEFQCFLKISSTTSPD
jgi:hypothetical protein